MSIASCHRGGTQLKVVNGSPEVTVSRRPLCTESALKRCSLCVGKRLKQEAAQRAGRWGRKGTHGRRQGGAAGPELASQRGLGCDSEASMRDSVNAGLPSPVCGPDRTAGS